MASRTTRLSVPLEHGDEVEHRRLIADRANASLPKDGSQAATHPIKLRDYLEANLPPASLWTGGLVFVSDLDQFKYSDGSSWKSVGLDETTADGLYHPKGAMVARNDQAGSYTLQASDAGKMIRCTSSSGVTVSVPGGTFSTNDVVNIMQWGAGQITFSATSGATLRYESSTFNAKSLGQFTMQTIYFVDGNNPVLGGQLELA